MHHLASAVHQTTKYILAATLLRETKKQEWYQATQAAHDIQVDAGGMTVFLPYPQQALLAQVGSFSILSITTEGSKFQSLVLQWKKERGITSSPVQMALCPSYQHIMAMGPSVVPLILRQLESEGDDPDHWFWALRYLTSADPVPADARGDMKRMAAAWITWGRQNLYDW